jgi:ABC-2 type transport system ATP-binding protein
VHPDSLTSAVATGPLPGAPPAIVDIRGLHVRFGSVDAVRGIDVSARAGEGTALLGRNGAGKSTTMRVLAGVVPPTEGVVLVAGSTYDATCWP